eukprot:scaffold25887_cov129-Isochrysis_galbana.AAC.1
MPRSSGMGSAIETAVSPPGVPPASPASSPRPPARAENSTGSMAHRADGASLSTIRPCGEGVIGRSRMTTSPAASDAVVGAPTSPGLGTEASDGAAAPAAPAGSWSRGPSRQPCLSSTMSWRSARRAASRCARSPAATCSGWCSFWKPAARLCASNCRLTAASSREAGPGGLGGGGGLREPR